MSKPAFTPEAAQQLRNKIDEIRASNLAAIGFIDSIYTLIDLTEHASADANLTPASITRLLAPLVERVEQQCNWIAVVSDQLDASLPATHPVTV